MATLQDLFDRYPEFETTDLVRLRQYNAYLSDAYLILSESHYGNLIDLARIYYVLNEIALTDYIRANGSWKPGVSTLRQVDGEYQTRYTVSSGSFSKGGWISGYGVELEKLNSYIQEPLSLF